MKVHDRAIILILKTFKECIVIPSNYILRFVNENRCMCITDIDHAVRNIYMMGYPCENIVKELFTLHLHQEL